MSGPDRRKFPEKVSPFLARRLQDLEAEYGKDSAAYRGLAIQYLANPREQEIDWKTERRRHYEADILQDPSGNPLKGQERLYRRVALIDLTTTCTAYCRYCLRRGYPDFVLARSEILRAAKFFGEPQNKDDLREVLITGGDPFLIPAALEFTIEAIMANAPNIRVVRIGSRLPVQQPDLVNDKLLNVLRPRDSLRIEVATQVNHPIELCEEACQAYQRLQEVGVTIYNQQVLLRGVNDTLKTLVTLYDSLRSLGIEAHYMFHCVPIRGISHLRTTVEEGLDLVRGLTSCGMISGRAKPMYTAMTDIGKITLYEGSIVDRKGDMLLLKSGYSIEERRQWNPSWKTPDSVVIDADGHMCVWYKDAKIHNEGWPSTYFTEAGSSLDGKAVERVARRKNE